MLVGVLGGHDRSGVKSLAARALAGDVGSSCSPPKYVACTIFAFLTILCALEHVFDYFRQETPNQVNSEKWGYKQPRST